MELENYVINDHDSDSDIELDIDNYKETRDKLSALTHRHSRVYSTLINKYNVHIYIEPQKYKGTKEEIPLSNYDYFNELDYETYGGSKHEIYMVCNLTKPCKHHVRNTEDGKIYLMDGVTICKLLMDDGVDVSDTHFDYCKETVNIYNIKELSDDMKEKISIYNHAKARVKKINEKIRKLEDAYKDNGKKYTSNNRLEQLKKKHNISA